MTKLLAIGDTYIPSALMQLDNVTVVPHIAGSTWDAFLGSPKLPAGHLRRMLLGQPPLPAINGVEPQLRAARS